MDEPTTVAALLGYQEEKLGQLPKTGTHRAQKSALKQDGVGPRTWDR